MKDEVDDPDSSSLTDSPCGLWGRKQHRNRNTRLVWSLLCLMWSPVALCGVFFASCDLLSSPCVDFLLGLMWSLLASCGLFFASCGLLSPCVVSSLPHMVQMDVMLLSLSIKVFEFLSPRVGSFASCGLSWGLVWSRLPHVICRLVWSLVASCGGLVWSPVASSCATTL